MMAPALTVVLHRDTHLFAKRPDLVGKLEKTRERILLAPDQLHHAAQDTAYLVRLGRLRVSEFLSDGREVTRAVLQAGAMFRTGHPGSGAPDPIPNPEADIYDLAHIVVMALGDVELWALPSTDLDIDS
jgi:hypothetical protein